MFDRLIALELYAVDLLLELLVTAIGIVQRLLKVVDLALQVPHSLGQCINTLLQARHKACLC